MADEQEEKTDPFLVVPNLKIPEMGILNPLMADSNISEIMVNDLRSVLVEKEGKLLKTPLKFSSLDELNRITRNILDTTGRVLSPDSPYVDIMLADGSRVNIISLPLTLHGPCITIRKFPKKRLGIEDLIANGSLDHRIAYFLNTCVTARLNLLICGGTGSGKTTLLNTLLNYIPQEERIVTIEDTAELLIDHINSVQLQTKPQTPASAPILARELVSNALRMRPDRIILGECRKAEAFDMLQAMNTGHAGSMSTLHANSPRDGLSRLETLCMMAQVDLPLHVIRKQISTALDLILQVKRFKDGKRRITSVCEVVGMEGEVITTQDLFSFDLTSGQFKSAGLIPSFLGKREDLQAAFPKNYFA